MAEGSNAENDQEDITDYSAFGRKVLVSTLAAQINNHLENDSPGIEPSLVVGVLGEWGSGKSTILHGLNDHYKQKLKSSSEAGPVTLPVFFNPWRFEAEVHLIVPLLKTAQSCVKRYLDTQPDSKTEKLKSSVVRLGQTAVALASAFKGKVSIPGIAELEVNVKDALDKEKEYLDDNARSAYNVDFDSIYFDLHQQMEQITGRVDGAGGRLNLLFLIDDLDRCLPEKAVQVMESVKLFLDARGCAFVLALDEEVVERGIVHRYRDYLFQGGNGSSAGDEAAESLVSQLPITGAEYLEKIIQLPIHLPRPDRTGIRNFLLKRFPGLFEGANKSKTEQPIANERDIKTSELALLDLFLKAIPPIPRKHVRAATLMQFLLDLAKGINFDQITLARLVMLQLFAPELYRHGKRNPAFLLTMEQWAEEHGSAWTSPALIDGLLNVKKRALRDLTEKPVSRKDEEDIKPGNLAESITTLEGDRAILQYISICTQNRSEFDPRNIIDPAQPSDRIIARYFSFIEERKAAKDSLVIDTNIVEASIGNVDAFIEQLASARKDAWLNAMQSEINAGESIPQAVFANVLERLSEFPGNDWLAQVTPVLTESQRYALQEKFNQEYQQAKDRVAKPPPGETEDNARAGRLLGWLGDERIGVGLDEDGLPDIDWLDIKAPNIAYSLNEGRDELQLDKNGKLLLDYDYKVSRYPVTWRQFQSFVDHLDGYAKDDWWQGMDAKDDDRQIETASWPVPNHPRDTLNWFQCMAFCRWLNKVKNPGDGQVISLPTEWEWQYAASGGDIKKFLYPWGKSYLPGYANIDETAGKSGPSFLEQTTAVGLYPPGDSGLSDMSGNVWEWCLNQADNKKIDDTSLGGTDSRALRGGSWNLLSELASAAFRFRLHPYGRLGYGGFRVFCVPSHRRDTDH